jgi:O-antigen ligase
MAGMAKTDAFLQQAIHFLFLGLFFFLPLIFWIPNSEVFELPKMYFVYAITTLIVGCWLARMTIRREILIKRTPLDIPILLFLLSQIVSTIYSIDPHVSWFGWYGRFNGGLLSTISYTVLYYAFLSNRFTIYDLRFTNKTMLLSAFLVAIYALLQHFGIDREFWVQDVMNRVFSTQGQPNWLAGYIAMVIPIAIIITNKYQSPINTNKPIAENNWVIGLLGYWVIGLFFTALLFSKSRSGLLGFAAADIVFWILIFVKCKRFMKTFLLIHGLMLALILITNNPVKDFFLNASRFPLTYQPINSSAIPLKSEHGGTESSDIRRLVWSGALKIAKQNPVFGTGPETFGLTYWQARPKEANLTSEWNFLYNKTHNEWLNLAANTGLFGLGTHLLLVGWFSVFVIRYSLNDNRKEKELLTINDSRLALAAFLSATLGLEVINFFGFSTVTTETYRYLFMGMAVMIKSNEQKVMSNEKIQRDKHHIPLLSTFYFLPIIFTSLFLLFQISRLYSADLNYNLGRQYYSAGIVGEAIKPLYQAVNLAPNEPVFRNELAEGLSAAAISVWADGNKDQAEKIKSEAVNNFKIASGQSKFNLTFIRTQAQMEFLMREIDPDLTAESLALAQKAIDLSPTDPRGYYLLGRMYEEIGEESKAKELYGRALELKPDYEEAKRLN